MATTPKIVRPTHGLGVAEFLFYQAPWSLRTFGPGPRVLGVCNHIRKELVEIAAQPADAAEWADVAILAIDGVWRSRPDIFEASVAGCKLQMLFGDGVEDRVLEHLVRSEALGRSRTVRGALTSISTLLRNMEAFDLSPGPAATSNMLRFERIAAAAIAGGTRWCAIPFAEFRAVMWGKLERNMRRQRPDWRQFSQDQAIEHVRTEESV